MSKSEFFRGSGGYPILRTQFISGDVQKARDVLKRLVSDFPKAPATGLAKELFKKIGS